MLEAIYVAIAAALIAAFWILSWNRQPTCAGCGCPEEAGYCVMSCDAPDNVFEEVLDAT